MEINKRMDELIEQILKKSISTPQYMSNPKKASNEMIISFNNVKKINNSFHIQTNKNTIISETVGYWKDKPVISYDNNKYVLLESSNNIVRIDNLGISESSITSCLLDTRSKEEEINKKFLSSIKNIINESIESVKQKAKPIEKKQEIVKKEEDEEETEEEDDTESEEDNEPPNEEEEIDKNEEEETTEENESSTDQYIDLLKKSEIDPDKKSEMAKSTEPYVDTLKDEESSSPTIDKNNNSNIDEESIMALIDKNRDDPRIKRLFSNHTDTYKRELHDIVGKYEKENNQKYIKMAHLFESGGGTNAVQFADGGNMNGSLNVRDSITINHVPVTVKKVFLLDGSNEYTIAHNMNTRDLSVTVYDENYEMVLCHVQNISLSATKLNFSQIVNNCKAIVIG